MMCPEFPEIMSGLSGYETNCYKTKIEMLYIRFSKFRGTSSTSAVFLTSCLTPETCIIVDLPQTLKS
jgi:hypothetical protein